jgi:predicted DNA-binding transcriptional regulator AlpA
MRHTPQQLVNKPKELRHLNEHELAELLNVSVATLRRWRILGYGPKFVKFGAAVRYSMEGVHEWVSSRTSGGEGGRRHA